MPRVSGTLVCLLARDGAVWVVDVATRRRLRLATSAMACDVSARRVVWIAAQADGAVFVRDLAASEP
jgi:hypothetical protein